MPRNKPTAVLIFLMLCGSVTNVRAQEPDASKFDQLAFGIAAAKAQSDCLALWADHALDPLRDKVALGIDATLPMLANRERLRPQDKRVMDLIITAIHRCRAAYDPALAILPPGDKRKIEDLKQEQDALIADLNSGKITFGDYNTAVVRIRQALSQIPQSASQIPQGLAALTEEAANVSEPVTQSRTTQSTSAPPVTRSPTTQSTSAPPVTQSPTTQSTSAPPVTQSPTTQSTSAPSAASEIRIALVIGDSNYSNLPKLANPENDARAIAELLQKIGFTTKLVTDASETDLRREVRNFAKDSANADVAFVFYAGHGAQVSGENYVLPIDMAIPETEADIQFAGLKVDDLVNSIRARTKIVFLDACRDNPALFANLVKGRGTYPRGLAPAVSSNFQQANPGGGVFIAYATDSGSVALDGQGEHSPFTQALLRNLDKPISIDDMFSLVTREVRLVTKNAQRPYKYASLENIVCLTGRCSTFPAALDTDVIEQAKHSESNDLQIALQTNNPDALQSYLQAYPDTSKRDEVLRTIGKLKRAEFNEWTLFEVMIQNSLPQHMVISSIEEIGDRVAVRQKSPYIPDEKYPDAAYNDALEVYDCKEPRFAISENTVVNKSGDIVYHYKWADPQFLDMSTGGEIQPGSVANTARNIVCHEELRTPLVTKKQLVSMDFASLSSTSGGDGEVFYQIKDSGDQSEQRRVLILSRMRNDTPLKFGPNVSLSQQIYYRTLVSLIALKCDTKTFSSQKTEHYDSSNNMVYLNASDPSKEPVLGTIDEGSVLNLLRRIVCTPREVQR